MREPALLLQPGAALVVERALVRNRPSSQPGKNTVSNSSPLADVQGHDVDGVGLGGLLVVHHQRNVLEKTLQVLELLHGAHQLLEVFQPAGGVGGAVLVPHLGVAALVEDDFGELGMRQRIALLAPAVERLEQRRATRPRGFGFSSSVATMARAAAVSGTRRLRA